MKTNARAITLIEIIMVLVLSGVVLLGACQLIISHFRFSITLQTGIALTQEVSTIVEDIKAKVSAAKCVQIDTSTGDIYLYDSTNTKTGTYTISGATLTSDATKGYTWSGGSSISYNSKILSNKLYTLTLCDPADPLNTATKLVTITAGVKNPAFPNVGPKVSTTNAYCRIPGTAFPVRLVDSAGVEKGKYSTIQTAINAAGETINASDSNFQDHFVYRYDSASKQLRRLVFRSSGSARASVPAPGAIIATDIQEIEFKIPPPLSTQTEMRKKCKIRLGQKVRFENIEISIA